MAPAAPAPANAGRDFLIALQHTLGGAKDVRVVSPSDHLKAHPTRARLSSLHAGSWIDGTFGIWIGHAEDRQGWKLLGDCRRAIERARQDGAPAASVQAASWVETSSKSTHKHALMPV